VTKIDTLLASYAFNRHLNESLREISYKAESMLDSIDALLSLASVLRTNYIRVLPLDMLLILRNLIDTRLAYLISGHQGKISLPESLPLAKGHTILVEEVWVNYLSNALKYSGEPDSIRVGADRGDEGMVHFWVCDQGKELSAKECESLFTPPIPLQDKFAKGHGLGLLIVRQIVEKLGGKVWIKSKQGTGNTFYFSLPEAE
jgi:signal transduction histidine kinase